MLLINRASLRTPLDEPEGYNRSLIGFTTTGQVVRIGIRLSWLTIEVDDQEIHYGSATPMFTSITVSELDDYLRWQTSDIRLSDDPIEFTAGLVLTRERLPDTSGYYHIDAASNPLQTQPAAWFNARDKIFTVVTGSGVNDEDHVLVTPVSWRPILP